MKRIGNIYEEMVSEENCRVAIINASKRKRNRRYVRKILNNLDYYAKDLSNRMKSGKYTTKYVTKTVKDGLSQKERLLQIPSFYPDQCAHHAIANVLMPIVIKSSYHWSCANIKGRGIKRACIGVSRSTLHDKKHAKYCMKLDIRKFYQSVDHDILKEELRGKIKDRKALDLIYGIIDTTEVGLPIGNYTSPIFAELLLQKADMLIKQKHKIRKYVRYADDFVMIDNNKRKLRRAFLDLMAWAKSRKLQVKNNYQLFRIYRDGRGRKIDFVGQCFAIGFCTVRKSKALAFMRQSRHIQKLQRKGLEIPFRIAAGFISRTSCVLHTNSYGLRKKYLFPVNMNKLKEAVRNESARKRESYNSNRRGVFGV